jgi:hypothetical protein
MNYISAVWTKSLNFPFKKVPVEDPEEITTVLYTTVHTKFFKSIIYETQV